MKSRIVSGLGRFWPVFSLGIPLVTFFATATILSIPPDTRGIDVANGKELFRGHCGACHFAKAGFPAHHGPNLHDIGRSGAARKPNQSAAEYILESILDPSAFVAPGGGPGMPRNLTAELDPEDVRNLVAYLASCGAVPDYQEIKILDIPDRRSKQSEPTLIRLRDMQLAEKVLRETGACLHCHPLHSDPEGMVFAPGIFGVGLSNKEAIQQSLLNPNQEIKPRYVSITVELENGQLAAGQLISQTDQHLLLCTRDDQNRLCLRKIPLDYVEQKNGKPQIQESKISLMPAGFEKVLSREEIEAVINLIRQLN